MNNSTDHTERGEFLLAMYEASWANITRSEDAIWKVFAAYTALFAGLAVAKDMIGFFGFVTLIVIFSLAGMVISINANQWFARNIAMVSNLEKEFLSKRDYGVVVPKSWAGAGSSRFFRGEIWMIMLILFLAVSLVSIYLLHKELSRGDLLSVVFILAIGLIVVSVYACGAYRRHKRFTDGASGQAKCGSWQS